LSPQRRAEVLLFAITIVWGSTFVITKGLLEENSPYFYSGIRFLSAASVVFVLFPKRCLRISASTARHGVILGLLLYVGFVFQTVGVQYTTSSKAAFFTGMLVPLTPVLHFVGQKLFHITKRPLTIGNILGVILAAFGLYLLTSPSGEGFNLGDALNLACAFFFAAFIVYLDTVPKEIDKLQMTFIQFLSCGLVGILFALPVEEIRISFSSDTIVGFSYLVIVATVITMWIQNRFQGDTTPTRAAVIFSLEPVVAAVFGYSVRNEFFGTVGVIGAAVTLAGLMISETSDSVPLLRYNVAQNSTLMTETSSQ
jgi:drug/metabolite transporter (DMT)-like permease